ncbi:MAG: Pantoate kinase [Methanoregula sp. SKADARSKE-2]|nr:MAG: Pantoate kinase [Methanoregula sp. SKADARSKE-2]
MKASAVIAFCPGHISGYFRRVPGSSPAVTGSIGSGIVISEGVTVTVRPSQETRIEIKRTYPSGRVSSSSGSLLISSALERLQVTASIVTECRLPIGAGFGLSAAALLASLCATNRLLGLGMSSREIALLAHEEEVIHRTGLGDVSACQGGGLVVRTRPGIDGVNERRFDLTGPLYAVSFGPIHTPEVLGSEERMRQVSAAFPAETPKDIPDFFTLCRKFTERSDLMTTEVKNTLERCDAAGVPASMTMLGNGVFACGRDVCRILETLGDVYEFHVAQDGVHIVREIA